MPFRTSVSRDILSLLFGLNLLLTESYLQEVIRCFLLQSMRSYSMRLLKKSTDPQKHKEAVDILKKASKLKVG